MWYYLKAIYFMSFVFVCYYSDAQPAARGSYVACCNFFK